MPTKNSRFLSVVLVASSWLLPAQAADAPAQPQARSGIEEVVVVFKCHYDIGFTDSVPKVMEAYRTTIMDKVLQTAEVLNQPEEPRKFSWAIPGWPLTQVLGAEQTPERRAKVLAALRDGTVSVLAEPFTPETEVLELEDAVQSLAFSSRICRSAGLELPLSAKFSDVPSQSWLLPTLLHHAGIKFLHLGSNPAAGVAKVPPLFWWEGPDGSRLLTAYTTDYGSAEVPPANWPHRTWLAMLVNGDNQGPQSADKVRERLDRIQKKFPNAKITVGSLDDFARAFLKNDADHLATLPVVRGDMPDTWIHGLQSMPIESALARRGRPSLSVLGALDTSLHAWGLTPSPVAPVLTAAFEQSLLYGEHTFGLDMKKVGYRYGEEFTKAYADGKYRSSDAIFEVHRNYARTMTGLVEPALAERTSALAAAVAVSGPRLVVVNPLPWTRDAEVVCKVGETTIAALRPAEGGPAIPVTIADGTVRFLARDLPAGGYRTYVPVTVAPPVVTHSGPAQTLANRFFRLTWSEAGVTSVVDLRTGRELLRRGGVLGQYRYELFSAADVADYTSTYLRSKADWAFKDMGKFGLPADAAHAEAAPTILTAKVETDASGQTLVLTSAKEGILTDPIRLSVRLPDDQPWIEVAWTIDNKTIDPWPEAGWLNFPFAIDQPKVSLGRLGGPIDPAKDVVPGTNRDVFCLSTGLTVTGADGAGVGLCPLDSPLVSLGRPGLWRYTQDVRPASAEVFVNLFNNQWSTNYPLFVGGSWTSRVRLWTVAANASSESALITPSWEARSPALSAFSTAASGKLPPTRSGLTVSRKGVLVTAFAPDTDAEGTVLRLWEQAGVGGTCQVTLPEGLTVNAVQPIDLRGQLQGAPIPVRMGTFEVTLVAYAPRSLRLTIR